MTNTSLIIAILLCIRIAAQESFYRSFYEPKAVILACESGKNEHILHSIDSENLYNGAIGGIGAVTGTAMNALYQDASPVIMTSGVYENIYFHAQLFGDCLSLSDDLLHKKYGLYKRFTLQAAISLFAQDCRYAYELYSSFNRLAMSHYAKSESLLKSKLLADSIFDKQKASFSFKTNNTAQMYDVGLFLQAYLAYTNSHVYCYKNPHYRKDNLYVCIPHDYAAEIGLPYVQAVDTTHPSNALWESVSGISLKELSRAEAILWEDMRRISEDVTYRQAFVNGVQQLLVQENTRWSIFMIGHGIYDQNGYSNDFFSASEEKSNCSTVGGLAVEQFRELLHYFNEKLAMNIFFYKSCSAGGQNFVHTFTDPISQKPLTCKYTIVTDTLNEAPTTAFIGTLPLACFRNGTKEYPFKPFEYIEHTTSKMKLGCIDYKTFFMLLALSEKNSEIWQKIFSCVSAWIGDFEVLFDKSTGFFNKKFCADILSIRLPGKELFSIVDHKDRCIAVDQSNVVIDQPYEALLLYQSSIGGITVKLPRASGDFPACISMLPGAAAHTIEFVRAENYTLSEVIKGFFTLEQLRSSKMITIKEVVCINDMPLTKGRLGRVVTFKDIILFNAITAGGKEVNTLLFSYKGTHFYYTFDALLVMPKDIRHLFKKIENVDSYTHLITSYEKYFSEFASLPPAHELTPITFDTISQIMKA